MEQRGEEQAFRSSDQAEHKESLHSGYGEYVSQSSAWDLAKAIATVIKEEKLAKIRNRSAISLG